MFRRFALRAVALVVAAVGVGTVPTLVPPAAPASAPETLQGTLDMATGFPSWAGTARVAGASVWVGMTQAQIDSGTIAGKPATNTRGKYYFNVTASNSLGKMTHHYVIVVRP